jgi:hypothetical protein
MTSLAYSKEEMRPLDIPIMVNTSREDVIGSILSPGEDADTEHLYSPTLLPYSFGGAHFFP